MTDLTPRERALARTHAQIYQHLGRPAVVTAGAQSWSVRVILTEHGASETVEGGKLETDFTGYTMKFRQSDFGDIRLPRGSAVVLSAPFRTLTEFRLDEAARPWGREGVQFHAKVSPIGTVANPA